MKRLLSLVIIFSYVLLGCRTSKTPVEQTGRTQSSNKISAKLDIIPRPAAVKRVGNGYFQLHNDTKIRFTGDSDGFEGVARQLAASLEHATGLSFATVPDEEEEGYHEILITSSGSDQISAEGYELAVETDRIIIRASTATGAFYGVQSLRQLLPVRMNAKAIEWKVPVVAIRDYPRFQWRGMHIDVSRHFFSEETIKEFIDYLAYYKFNKLHMHLTDDQGWRLQIKQYPKLTEEGAWRTFNSHDSVAIERAKENPDFLLPEKHIRMRNGQKEYGGFYTRQQMKRIIAYAKDRHITIVPEIDMPGHLMSAIQSYPSLSCTGEAAWGETFSVPVCPCKESAMTFLKNVLDEVVALFPGEYIHIGADEVEKTTWRESAQCRKLMEEKNLENVEEIQSYFVDQMANYLQSKGKKVIGWDEIIEGGIPDDVTMMYWRSWVPKAPKIAAENGNNIIISPTSCCYFDYPQNAESLRQVYRFELVPESFTSSEASLVMGAQANLWSEWIPSRERLYYMAMPRMLALSEVVWSEKEDRSWKGFSERIQTHYNRLDMQSVNYRQPDLKGFHPLNVFIDEATVSFEKPREEITLRYTSDGSEPTEMSTKYTGSFRLTETTTVRVKSFLPTGAVGASYKTRYMQQDPHPAVSLDNPSHGLRVQYTEGAFQSVEEFDLDSVQHDPILVESFRIPEKVDKKFNQFALEFNGYIKIPKEGVYTFYTSTDDGSRLYVGNRLVVDNDGPHAEIEKSAQVALEAGYQPITLKFFELGGGYALNVFYEGPGISTRPVTGEIVFHKNMNGHTELDDEAKLK